MSSKAGEMLLPHTPSTLAPHAFPTLLPQIPRDLHNASTIMGAAPFAAGPAKRLAYCLPHSPPPHTLSHFAPPTHTSATDTRRSAQRFHHHGRHPPCQRARKISPAPPTFSPAHLPHFCRRSQAACATPPPSWAPYRRPPALRACPLGASTGWWACQSTTRCWKTRTRSNPCLEMSRGEQLRPVGCGAKCTCMNVVVGLPIHNNVRWMTRTHSSPCPEMSSSLPAALVCARPCACKPSGAALGSLLSRSIEQGQLVSWQVRGNPSGNVVRSSCTQLERSAGQDPPVCLTLWQCSAATFYSAGRVSRLRRACFMADAKGPYSMSCT